MTSLKWFLLVVLGVPAAPQAVSDYRLPMDVVPLTYSISIDPDITAGTFAAEMVMQFRALQESPALILNVKNLSIDYSKLVLSDTLGAPCAIRGANEDTTLERLIIKPSAAFIKHKDYQIRILYKGRINDEGVGLYKSFYTDDFGRLRYFLVTQLRPVHARRLFPCLDEPAFRASLVLNILHSPTQEAISSMPVATVTSIQENKMVTTFQPTPKIPPFLLAFVLSDLPRVKGNGTFAAFSVPSKIFGASYAAQVGSSLANAMAAHTGLPYILQKTDLFALPLLVPVAMENWGLFTFREANSLFFEGMSKTKQKQNVARFVGHEVAHMWMGNPVSIEWWDYLWLSEVFAMYYEYYLPGRVEPSWQMMNQLVIDLHQDGLLSDSSPMDPLTTSILTPAQISAKFSGLTYSKGPALLRMVINVLTEKEFLIGFRKFLTENAFNSVEPNDLWNALDNKKNLPANLTDIMANWTDISGYPVVTVVKDNKGYIQLSQKTFTLEPPQKPDGKTWWIPLSYTTNKEVNFRLTMPKMWFAPQPTQQFPLSLSKSDWIIFNIDSTGFFRVNYDADIWRSLIGQLYNNFNKIGLVNRAQLLDDSLNLARAGQLGYGFALDLARYLTQEREFVPWSAALNAFTYIDDILFNSDLHKMFTEYLSTLLEDVYNEIGFNEQPGEAHLTKLLREIIVKWACQTQNADCIRRSLSYIETLTNHLPQTVSVDVEDTALCTGVAKGGSVAWRTISSLYENSVGNDKTRFLAALACSTDAAAIQGFLMNSLNVLNETEWNTIFRAMASRKENAQALLEMVLKDFMQIQSRYGASNLAKYVNQISVFLTTKSQQQLLGTLEKLSGQALTSAKSLLAGKIAWLDRNLEQLTCYFQVNTQYKLRLK